MGSLQSGGRRGCPNEAIKLALLEKTNHKFVVTHTIQSKLVSVDLLVARNRYTYRRVYCGFIASRKLTGIAHGDSNIAPGHVMALLPGERI